MQIPPSQWTSAAAAALPQLSSRPAGTSTAAPTTLKGVEQVVQGDQTQDRDADERYDGKSGEQSNQEQPLSEEQNKDKSRKLDIQLAAEDPEPPPSFESWG